MTHRYDDILHLPHHVSATRPPMPLQDRAAQFSPFAALTGYDAAVEETARLTDSQPELDESEKERINTWLLLLQEGAGRETPVRVLHFVPDEKKAGGACVSTVGLVKKVDEYARSLLLADGLSIPFERILAIESVEE